MEPMCVSSPSWPFVCVWLLRVCPPFATTADGVVDSIRKEQQYRYTISYISILIALCPSGCDFRLDISGLFPFISIGQGVENNEFIKYVRKQQINYKDCAAFCLVVTPLWRSASPWLVLLLKYDVRRVRATHVY